MPPFRICQAPCSEKPLHRHLLDVPTVDDHWGQSDYAGPQCFISCNIKTCPERADGTNFHTVSL